MSQTASHRARTAPSTNAPNQYLYRAEQDDDGDPVDHGVVAADSMDEAAALLREEWIARETLNEDCPSLRVRFYLMTAPSARVGVWGGDADVTCDIEIAL